MTKAGHTSSFKFEDAQDLLTNAEKTVLEVEEQISDLTSMTTDEKAALLAGLNDTAPLGFGCSYDLRTGQVYRNEECGTHEVFVFDSKELREQLGITTQ